MKPAILALLVVGAALPACSADDTSGRDPASRSSSPPPMPSEVPAADGPVATDGLVTVMDRGSPELCLGAVALSYPPQCGGPAIVNWDWAEHGRGMFERSGGVRWGSFHLVGRWDGSELTVEEAVPAALHDALVQAPSDPGAPASSYGPERLREIAAEVGRLPGAQGANVADGRVHVDVTYDDGSLQAWCDTAYGEDVVVVSSQLLDQDG
jgi:hypothetical protein